MVSQDTPRKVLRIDDVLENSETTREELPPVASPMPNTRNAVKGQFPGSGPTTPEQKFSASYQRALEVKEQSRQEMLEAQKMQQIANSNPTPSLQLPNQDPPAIVVPPQPQQIEQLQSDLSLLVFAGRIEEEVVVSGFKFKMTTLTSGEQEDFLAALALVTTKDDLVKLGQLRLQILARSIRTVNGVPLEQLYQGVGATNSIDKKIAFLKSTQMSLVLKLFDIYQGMLERSEKVFIAVEKEGDLLKN